MNDYYLVRFNMTPCIESETDILAALLGEKNFESFVPDAEGLSAYVKKEMPLLHIRLRERLNFQRSLSLVRIGTASGKKTISNQLCLRTGVLSTVRSITTIRLRNTTS